MSTGQSLVCVECERPINPGANYRESPPAHIHCITIGGGWRAPESDLHPWTKSLRQIGYCWTGPWYEASATRAEHPDHAAYWDLPSGHLGWVVVSQTPCPGADEELPHWVKSTSYLCREKHVHTSRAERAS
jgi:hypothetical protein